MTDYPMNALMALAFVVLTPVFAVFLAQYLSKKYTPRLKKFWASIPPPPERLSLGREQRRKQPNSVADGDYVGYAVILAGGAVHIVVGFFKTVRLDGATVSGCALVGQGRHKSVAKSAAWGALGLTQGLGWGVAAYMLGGNEEIFDIAVNFKDGKRSLLRVNRKIALALCNAGGGL